MSLPEWYPRESLHDAEVISVTEKNIGDKDCLEIGLDTSSCVYDPNISKIRFVDFKLLGFEAKLPDKFPANWLRDDLIQESRNRYRIKIKLVNGRKHSFMELSFSYAETERK